jgi:putative CocE/NonD family hydrolase
MAWNGISPVDAARHGFLAAIQDVRGRFASEGDWEPVRHEGRDGADTVAWVAQLPASSGRVGMVGGSYCGNTQWLAALKRPESLAAINPAMTWGEPLGGLVSRGGATELALTSSWSLV